MKATAREAMQEMHARTTLNALLITIVGKFKATIWLGSIASQQSPKDKIVQKIGNARTSISVQDKIKHRGINAFSDGPLQKVSSLRIQECAQQTPSLLTILAPAYWMQLKLTFPQTLVVSRSSMATAEPFFQLTIRIRLQSFPVNALSLEVTAIADSLEMRYKLSFSN